jgi:hypothetical protein
LVTKITVIKDKGNTLTITTNNSILKTYKIIIKIIKTFDVNKFIIKEEGELVSFNKII